jgi:hypothetical protein
VFETGEAWMAETLHRCSNLGAKFATLLEGAQKALDGQGIAYEVVPGPWRPKNRTIVIEGTGHRSVPVSSSRMEPGTARSRRKWRAPSARAARWRNGVASAALSRWPYS